MKLDSYYSLFIIAVLSVCVVILYNFSVSDIHKTIYNNNMNELMNRLNHKEKSSLIVPTYNQNSYVSQNSFNDINEDDLKLKSMVNVNNNNYEEKKKTRMEFYNLCYDDIINDNINIQQSPLNLYVN